MYKHSSCLFITSNREAGMFVVDMRKVIVMNSKKVNVQIAYCLTTFVLQDTSTKKVTEHIEKILIKDTPTYNLYLCI